jgi:sn-glycerol 3-phosphate transport system permease protein
LAGASLLVGFPFYWMVITALKSPAELALSPPTLWPRDPRWSNFAEAWRAAPFPRMFVNSLVTSAAATVLQVVTALGMAYAFAIVRFPGKGVALLFVLATMMVPDELRLIPNYLLMDRLSWIDTYWALIVPPAAHAFPLFVLYVHVRGIPRELIDAARVDGAGHFRVLARVVFPLSGPVAAAVAVVVFVGRWNDFLWPLVVTNTESMRTLPIGLAYLKSSQESAIQWQVLMAGALFVIIPLLALFALAQRRFVAAFTQRVWIG